VVEAADGVDGGGQGGGDQREADRQRDDVGEIRSSGQWQRELIRTVLCLAPTLEFGCTRCDTATEIDELFFGKVLLHKIYILVNPLNITKNVSLT
jgi:hypothetical protein